MNVTPYFENHKAVIFEQLSKAQKSVSVAVAWINFKEYYPVFEKLLNKKVKLKIICTDNYTNSLYLDQIETLRSYGAEIKLLKMPSVRNHMHHKFAVVDAHTVVSGSFNWSVNAIKSFENIIVMSDAAEQAVKFLAEFDKLWKLDTPAIKTLQSRLRCRRGNCTGQQYNMLVFSSAHSKYYELTGDLIEVCGHCMHYTTLQHCIEDNQLILLFEDYRASPDEDTAVLDMIIQNHLNSYIKNSIVIHALARVEQDLDYGGNDELNTVVLWKNKFVGDGLPSSFPEVNFGVAYDNTSSF